MSSHVLDPTRGVTGFATSLASVRDRRDRRRRNPNRNGREAPVHVLVKIPPGPAASASFLIEPEMIGSTLLTVQQAFGEVPNMAKQTHRNDPSKVNKILFCGSPTDRI
jgi:hypothetical protein